jgi:1-acyl-sn-glycerol-3-phosphate acyltransferase
VPVGIVGAEEQWPQLGKIEGIHAFGIPYLPVVATPLPMPVHYHIHYGEPIDLSADFRPEDAENPTALRVAADRVRSAVAGLLERGLERRQGVFL